ncbi:ABC transporter ATP-binding protein [Dactylosporangium sp. NPDC051484]|uniref:ABC transporter ATP-binding protein n=1 Tax=Dactylosporangium sp. NPDC051484 TaxID=3154942 RepID=UPI00344EF9E3
MPANTVSVTGLVRRYGRHTALGGVSLSLSTGVTGLLGPNGAGKTTLLRILATALSPDQGAIDMLGIDPLTAKGKLEARRVLGYLPQHPGFHPGFTAFEFIDYVGILRRITDRAQRHDEARRVLDAVGLSDVRGKKIKTLSGGMRQRVALAAAIVGDPRLLILDEPTVGLDPKQRLRFRELIAELGEGRAVLLSTHQTEDVGALCQHVVVLAGGTVRFDGTPAALSAFAAGRVWHSAQKDPGAVAGWRTGQGTVHNIGSPPPGAALLEPSLEDGYLLLLDGDPALAETA